MHRPTTPLILFGLACLAVAACANLGPKADPSRFFTLTPLPQAEEPAIASTSDRTQLSLGIGPIKFPGYLDRQELVTRISHNRFEVAENDRWAEPLEENFTRILLQNLSSLLRTERIIRYPWQTSQRPTYQVEIEVLRFEPNSARSVQLIARWTIRDAGTKQELYVRESRLTHQVNGTSTEQSVAALSESLGAFSREIADAVGAVEGQKKL